MKGVPRDRTECRNVHHKDNRSADRTTGPGPHDHKKRQKKMKYPELTEFIPAGTPAVNDYPDDNKDYHNYADNEENPAR